MIWPRYLASIIIYSSLPDSASGLLASLLFPRLTNTLPLRTFHLLFRFSGIFLLASIPMACSLSSLWSLLYCSLLVKLDLPWLHLNCSFLSSHGELSVFCIVPNTIKILSISLVSFVPISQVKGKRYETRILSVLFKSIQVTLEYNLLLNFVPNTEIFWKVLTFSYFFFLFSNLSLIFSCVQ